MLTRASASSVARQPLCRACAVASRTLLPTALASPSRRSTRNRTSYFVPPQPPAKRQLPGGFRPPASKLTPQHFRPPSPPSSLHLVRLLVNRLTEYVESKRFAQRLADYGLETQERNRLIAEWDQKTLAELESAHDEDSAKEVLAKGSWGELNLSQSFTNEGSSFANAAEGTLHRNFLTFVAGHPSISGATRQYINSILDVTDISNLPFEADYVKARSMTREFHLHIGPTNSGKTYNALKALAKAKTGAYAGPLRLLAHEVWERMNLGTVGGLDGKGKECNLLTGEERRIVNLEAGIMSCTVEMLPMSLDEGGFDVVVIDEIQMMGDPSRGGAWTRAVMGVCAKEIHLCGDETTVDLLRTLIPLMGDKMTIHQYNRLTPLKVAEDSLEGDWENIEAGDAVVAFSRNKIYDIKKQIEGIAAKKCAVIYGALPPETRADQARDFNDEDGRCEVLVASDAVGMGLNLRIKRIIFATLEKFNGKADVPLSLTQIKQIAGRAGRYGMHRKQDDPTVSPEDLPFNKPDESTEQGGIVTTLHPIDLPILRAVLPMELPKIKRATIDVPFSVLSELSVILPPSTSYASVLDHLRNLVLLPPNTRSSDIDQLLPIAKQVEPFRNQLTLFEIDLFTRAPINQRDPSLVAIFQEVVRLYADEGLVEVEPVFGPSRLLTMLDIVEGTLATLPPLPPIIGIGRRVLTPPVIVSSIPQLESMHKALVMYIWLSFRLEVAFPDRTRAVEIKERVEVVLDDCLARFPGLRNLKTHERGKDKDRQVAKWRRANVAPNGTQKTPGAGKKGILWVEDAVIQRLKNKQIWQSTGIVPAEKVLRERDGRGLEYMQAMDQRRQLAIEGGERESSERGHGGNAIAIRGRPGAKALEEEYDIEPPTSDLSDLSKKGGARAWHIGHVPRPRLSEREFERLMEGKSVGERREARAERDREIAEDEAAEGDRARE